MLRHIPAQSVLMQEEIPEEGGKKIKILQGISAYGGQAVLGVSFLDRGIGRCRVRIPAMPSFLLEIGSIEKRRQNMNDNNNDNNIRGDSNQPTSSG